MLHTPESPVLEAEDIIEAWIERFNTAIVSGDPGLVRPLFRADSHWRDVVGLSWNFATVSGRERIAERLVAAAEGRGARNFSIDRERYMPRFIERAGEATVEAIIRFDTEVGGGTGVVRFKRGDASVEESQAWILLTALDYLEGSDEATVRARRQETPFERDFHGPNWLDRRLEALRFTDRNPAVLIVGGGHAGLTTAARLNALGVENLVIDRMKRVGDNWRLRYHGLKLHNKLESNHLPYLPFPKTWPDYIAKDQMANWLEFYVDAMEINFWTETEFLGATYDKGERRWTASLKLADGGTREIYPRHVVMATSVSGTPNIPKLPTLERFKGPVRHSSQYKDGAEWKGKNVVVFGTGTSGHDIAQDLHAYGAKVTIVQRSSTLVTNVEPSAQLYDGIYYGDGPPFEDRDLLNASFPLPVMKQAHKLLTERSREYDAELLSGLRSIGFQLDHGYGDTGWPLKFRERGGGYYFNVGCSDLLIRREVGLLQYADVETFEAGGILTKTGTKIPADLIVLATGYKGQEHLVHQLFGDEVAERVGTIWGFDEQTQELRNMWMRTGQPGLWFTAGAFSLCRNYSKYLALQIKASELGLLSPSNED